jgi:dipeptidyl aminopeptidase/acylaminoacyl peptidase
LSPDGVWTALGTNNGLSIRSTDGAERVIARDLPGWPRELSWAPDGSGVFFLMRVETVLNMHYASLDEEVTKVTAGDAWLREFTSASGQFAAIRSTPHQPEALITFSISDPAQVKELFDPNGALLDGVELGELEEFYFSLRNGEQVRGRLTRPVNFEMGKKYPVIMEVYPTGNMMPPVFSLTDQLWAAQGYAVLRTDFHTSLGSRPDPVLPPTAGSARTTYFDYMDAALDAAVAKGWIEEQNLFLYGSSAGGTLTADVIGQSDRFAAVCIRGGVTDRLSFAGTRDKGERLGRHTNRVWEDPMDYVENSALTYAANVTTPTLLYYGEDDLRVPISQGEEFFRALMLQGKEAVMVRAPGLNHSTATPSQQLAQQLYMLAWFEKHRR